MDTNMPQIKVLVITNIIGLAVTIIINVLAVILPIAGKTTQELSDLYPNLFVPAGITFSIWGLIYFLLIAMVSFQAYELWKNRDNIVIKKIGWLFAVTCLANIIWIFAWHYQALPLSLIAMVVLLISLIQIHLRLNIGVGQVSNNEKYFVHLPISIYLGWITVATVANISALLVAYHWNRFGLSEIFWTILVIIIILIITSAMIIIRRDISYSLVVIWALIGIIIKRSAYSLITSSYIVLATSISIGIIILIIIFSKIFNQSNKT